MLCITGFEYIVDTWAQIKADSAIWRSGRSQVVAVQGPMPGQKAEAAAEAAMAASLALESATYASCLASEPEPPTAVLQPQCTDREEAELDAMGCAGASESPIAGEEDMDDIFLTLDASLTDEAMGEDSEPVEGMTAPAKCTLASLKYIKPLTLVQGQA